jgi:hypothetical protein
LESQFPLGRPARLEEMALKDEAQAHFAFKGEVALRKKI